MARKKHEKPLASEELSLSRSVSSEYYGNRLKSQSRRRIAHITLAAIATILVCTTVAIAAFVNDINTKITGHVDEKLQTVLATQEAGKPFYMLLIGVDKANWREDVYGAEESGYRSDTMIVARIDPSEKKVTLVSIHRDTLVDLSPYGYGSNEKINAAFSYGQETLTTKVISDFADVPISHYAEVDMDGLWDIVDSLGGIDVDVPMDIDDEYTNLHLKKGRQHLDGHDTVRYCRCRHAYDALGDGDRYRANVQRQVIGIIAKKVLQSDPATMAKTISTAAGYVRTDLDVQSILSLAMQFIGMDFDNNFYTGMEPTTARYINETWYELCDTTAWRKMMRRVDQGLPPTEKGDVDALETSPDNGEDVYIDTTGTTSTDSTYYDSGTSTEYYYEEPTYYEPEPTYTEYVPEEETYVEEETDYSAQSTTTEEPTEYTETTDTSVVEDTGGGEAVVEATEAAPVEESVIVESSGGNEALAPDEGMV